MIDGPKGLQDKFKLTMLNWVDDFMLEYVIPAASPALMT
jgi:hypothetical protein